MNAKIESEDIKKLTKTLEKARNRLSNSGRSWVKKLINYAHHRMRIHSKGRRSHRSVRKLSNSITKEVKTTKDSIEGISYVPKHIKYQFAAEYGFKIFKFRAIKAKTSEFMVFHISDWKGASRKASIKKLSAGGYLFFRVVSRGRYEGLYYTYKSFIELTKYYNANRGKMSENIANSILLSTSGAI